MMLVCKKLTTKSSILLSEVFLCGGACLQTVDPGTVSVSIFQMVQQESIQIVSK